MKSKFKIFTLIITIFYLMSCQTNKAPRWIDEPPDDDELHIYIVGVGEGEDVLESVVKQLKNRFNLNENSYLTELVMSLLKESFYSEKPLPNSQLSIIDRWNNDDTIYILVRLNRDFFDPLIDLFVNEYEDMNNYIYKDEITGDTFYLNGDIYSAAKLYLAALDYMLNEDNDFYNISIKKVMDKILKILINLSPNNIEKFDLLKISHPVEPNRLLVRFNTKEGETLDGFLYNLKFVEGWNLRQRKASIPIKDNVLEFIPPNPKKSGTFDITAKLDLEAFINIVKPWENKTSIRSNIQDFISEVTQIMDESIVSFDYKVESEIITLPNIISFNNSFINEGVVRALLEDNIEIQVSPIIYGDETLLNYIREVSKITSGLYRYMVLGGDIIVNKSLNDEGTLYKIDGELFLIDLYNSVIVSNKRITSEFLSSENDDDSAYLDYGLKVGEIIYNWSF